MAVINVQRVLELIGMAEENAIEEVADFIAADARSRAPVRKVFKETKGFRRKFRPLTKGERSLAIRRALAYAGYSDFQRRRSVAYLQHYAQAELHRRGSLNNIGASRNLRVLGIERNRKMKAGGTVRQFVARTDARRIRSGFDSPSLNPLLTARGRYEVRSGRAIHRQVLASGNVRVQIGGALKASIVNEGVVQTGQGATAKVTAGVRYAKFVEFPTTHNASQPFLLPALHDSRTRLKRTLSSEIRKALGG